MAIDVGAEAIDRPSGAAPNYTFISLDNPANESGVITSVEVWAYANITELRVGTFYLVSGSTYKCRASATLGSVTAGSKQTFSSLSINVEAGDLIGSFYDDGNIAMDNEGYAGLLYASGEYIDPNDQATFSEAADNAMSLKGIGGAAVVGHSFGSIIG